MEIEEPLIDPINFTSNSNLDEHIDSIQGDPDSYFASIFILKNK
jgi:hypothetical protein